MVKQAAKIQWRLSLSDFYELALRQAENSVQSYSSSLEAEGDFQVQTAVKLSEYRDASVRLESVLNSLLNLVTKHPDKEARILQIRDATRSALCGVRDASDASQAIAAYSSLRSAFTARNGGSATKSGPHFTMSAKGEEVVLVLDEGNSETKFKKRMQEAVVRDNEDSALLLHTAALIDSLRDRQVHPSDGEALAVLLAEATLRDGRQQPRMYKSLSLPGRHPKHQSFVFVTDAGPDHVKITVQSRELMDNGIVVHIEHIDRSETSDRSLMEAYRLPSHIEAARVRLHVADLAPASCFIGRPTFEGLPFNAQFPHDQSGDPFAALGNMYSAEKQESHNPSYFFEATLLKASHQIASACSAMFEAGICDAKIAFENMTEKQAIRFANAVVANVRRDPEKQYLSAAFNVFRPIYSETYRKKLVDIDDIIAIAVKITSDGNFDKVTLDGASGRKGASKPIVDTLSRKQMLHFNHIAHEAGLFTYFSAGINPSNLHKAVYTGVDGMGIGFALHSQKDGVVGALSLEKIDAVLTKRNEAEQTIFGKSSKKLAYLDYCASEGTLTEVQEKQRIALFDVLNVENTADIDQNAVLRLMDDVEKADVKETEVSKSDKQGKTMALATRLLTNIEAKLTSYLEEGWESKITKLKSRNDVQGLRRMLDPARRRHKKAHDKTAVSAKMPADVPAEVPVEDGEKQDKHLSEDSIDRLAKIATHAISSKPVKGIAANKVVEEADLSGEDPADIYANIKDKIFLGLKSLPKGVSEADLLRRGAIIVKPRRYIPFKIGRDHLYTVDELIANDREIYNWYKHYLHDTYDETMKSLHDGVILDLLRTEYSGKKQVGIMGGHAMLRTDEDYRKIALLTYELAKEGFVVASGGGPGAMEAANLGAHFSNYTIEDLEWAIRILKKIPSFKDDPNNELAAEVLKKFPEHSALSLGVPTWLYGHEPPNLFCKHQAKFFSNAIREDILVLSCNCGILFAPGSAGTRTEIAQFTVPNKYSKETGADFSKPMIFYGNFWIENTVYQTYLNVAQNERLVHNRPELHYSNKIYNVTNTDEILKIIREFCATYYPYGNVDYGVAPQDPKPRSIRVAKGSIEARALVPRTEVDIAKRNASYVAVDAWVTRDGLIVGIGSGTTVAYAIDRLAQVVHSHGWKNIVCIPTSADTRVLLDVYKDVLTVRDMLTDDREMDVTIDGADEIDPSMSLIKGGGGALMHERVVAQNSKYYIIVAHWTKESTVLGEQYTRGIPIEVQPLSWKRVLRALRTNLRSESAKLRLVKREEGEDYTPYVTDNGNFLIDVVFGKKRMQHLQSLRNQLHHIAGICAVGIFLYSPTMCYVGYADGEVRTRTRVATSPGDMIVSSERQKASLQAILKVVKNNAEKGKNPVVELDLDLTTMMPYKRTIAGLMVAGKDYQIQELEDFAHAAVSWLPGYTAQAWNEWLKLEDVQKLMAKYPTLPWAGSDEHKDTPFGTKGATVHSSFHRRFWEDADDIAQDIPTEGLADFEAKVHKAGGKLVFVSGRWKSEMVDATYEALRRAKLQHRINLVIGNPGHDAKGDKKLSDAEAKALLQKQVVEKYGLPVAYVDDRLGNLKSVAGLKDIVAEDFVYAVSCVPGYSAAIYHQDQSLHAISNFFVDRPTPSSAKDSTVSDRSHSADMSRLTRRSSHGIDFDAGYFDPDDFVADRAIVERAALTETIDPSSISVSTADAEKRMEKKIVRVGTFNVENLFRRFDFKKGRDEGEEFDYSDLKFTIMDEKEKTLTAAVIRAINADVLALQEVESLDLLDRLNVKYLDRMYKYRTLIQGNDLRGINVAVMSRYPFTTTNTFRFANKEQTVVEDEKYSTSDVSKNRYIFSRDCLQVAVDVGTKKPLYLYINHFKSMGFGGRLGTKPRREAQVMRVKEIVEQEHGSDIKGNVIILGDFNDYEEGESAITHLTKHAGLENVVNRLASDDQWTHYWSRGKEYKQLDYLLVSKNISRATKDVLPIIEHRGQPWRAKKYSGPRFKGIGQNRPKASDHSPITLDIDFSKL